MPILTLQRRAVELGRIRTGVVVPTGDGKTRPAKLGVLRFTSRNEGAIRTIATRYGGDPRRWDDAQVDEQWEVITTVKEIPVSIPPGHNTISQWFEVWAKGGCQRRCDGETEHLTGRPCLCGPDPATRACKATTRVNVILPDVSGIGVWRLESHGYHAAAELAGIVEALAAVRAAGVFVPAVLRLEQRQVVRAGKTHNFAVPVLAVQSTMREIQGMAAGTIALPPAPPDVLAIEAGPAQAPTGVAPDAATSKSDVRQEMPADPVEMAAAIPTCPDIGTLNEWGRYARTRSWMDEMVPSKYAPNDGEWIELVEAFRGRQAELTGQDER